MTRADYIQVSISNDPSTLGPDADRENLDRYAAKLAAELGREFGVEVQVSPEAFISRPEPRWTHPDLELTAFRVQQRLIEIEAGDEWIDLVE